jgi:hypothetical protein
VEVIRTLLHTLEASLLCLDTAVFNRWAVAPWGAMNDNLGRRGFFYI